MNEKICNNLDDYLAGELNDPRRTEFAKHLEDCAACREELLAQTEVARLLRTATEMLEAPPQELKASIRRGLAVTASRRRRWVAVAAMMSAVVVGAASWGLRSSRDGRVVARPQPDQRIAERPVLEHRQADDRSRQETANVADASGIAPAATVRLASTPDTIAVPIKSENPNVTIFWLYPVVRTTGR